MSRRLRVLDAFCGTWGFSAGFAARGDVIVGVDLDARSADDAPPGVEFIRADVRELRAGDLGAFDVALFGPPCPEFSGMRHANPRLRGVPPSSAAFENVEAAFRLARDVEARWWAVENVRGAVKWWSPLYGEPTHRLGAWYLWACLPPIVWPPMPAKLGARAVARNGRGREGDLGKSGRERSRSPRELADALADGVHAWVERRPFAKPAVATATLPGVVA